MCTGMPSVALLSVEGGWPRRAESEVDGRWEGSPACSTPTAPPARAAPRALRNFPTKAVEGRDEGPCCETPPLEGAPEAL